MTGLNPKKLKTVSKVSETKTYWLKVAPSIWPSTSAKKKALKVFEEQKVQGVAFDSPAALQARISALRQLLS